MLCDDYCDYCYYNTIVSDPEDDHRFVACDYIGYTGHRRPCPPGRLCSVRIELERPRNVSYKYDPESAKAYYLHCKAVLHGQQREAITSFMLRTGETKKSIARLLGISPETVRKWIAEYQFANWSALAAIGLDKPPGMPTIETHPVDRTRGAE